MFVQVSTGNSLSYRSLRLLDLRFIGDSGGNIQPSQSRGVVRLPGESIELPHFSDPIARIVELTVVVVVVNMESVFLVT